MIPNEEINRMRWASRRGMLELDLVLEPFVEQRYAKLDAVDRERYKQLMTSEDQDLFSWFMSRNKPGDKELATIVEQILRFTHADRNGEEQ
ncbi:MAG TPA: succinate dehydrogenase assembly factor 2 [Kineobactrum sp.]